MAEARFVESKTRVVATIYPLAFFAQQVGGSAAEVIGLVPAGVEAHEWEPSPRDMGAIEKASVFVYNGAGFEPWAERVRGIVKPDRPVMVDASAGLELLKALEQQRGPGRGGRPAQEAAAFDPHVWLDPVLAQAQALRIQEGLAKGDPAHGSVYQENVRRLLQRLRDLDEQFRAGLAQCQKRTFFTAHAAFGYMAQRYSLEMESITGLTPEASPSPARLGELTRLARERGMQYIFFETLTSPEVARTLAREIGAQTLVLNPIEGLTQEEAQSGHDYFTLMEANLANLRKALQCR